MQNRTNTESSVPVSTAGGPMTSTSPNINRWRAFALLAVSFFMTIIDLTIVNVSLPTIGRDLHFSQTSLQWVVTAYAWTFGGFLLLGGRAADLVGRRRILMLGFTILLLISNLIAAFALNLPMLLIGRVLLGAALGGFGRCRQDHHVRSTALGNRACRSH